MYSGLERDFHPALYHASRRVGRFPILLGLLYGIMTRPGARIFESALFGGNSFRVNGAREPGRQNAVQDPQ
jgi:hypothetical protein